MKVKNISKAVINIGGKYIIPNQTAIVGDEWGKNPVVKDYIKEKMIEVEKAQGDEKVNSIDDMVADLAELSADSGKRALNAFAKKYGVNIEGAETTEDLYSLIFSFVELAKKHVN